MRRVDEVQLDIGRANVPEPYEVLEVRGIANEKSGVVPHRADRVVAAHAVPCQIPEADTIVYFRRDRQILIDGQIDRRRGLPEDLPIVDADLGYVRVRAVLHKERLAERIVRLPGDRPHASLVASLPSWRVLVVDEHVVDVEQMRPRRPSLLGQKQPVRKDRIDEMRKLLREFLDRRGVSNGPDDIGPEPLDELLGLFRPVNHHDGVEASPPERVGQPDRPPERLAVRRLDRPRDPERPVANIDTRRVHGLAPARSADAARQRWIGLKSAEHPSRAQCRKAQARPPP
jgi:hypothetical protein